MISEFRELFFFFRAQGRLTVRRKKELDRKKKHRLFHFTEKMREGIIIRRHLAHHTCDQVVLQSTVSCPKANDGWGWFTCARARHCCSLSISCHIQCCACFSFLSSVCVIFLLSIVVFFFFCFLYMFLLFHVFNFCFCFFFPCCRFLPVCVFSSSCSLLRLSCSCC